MSASTSPVNAVCSAEEVLAGQKANTLSSSCPSSCPSLSSRMQNWIGGRDFAIGYDSLTVFSLIWCRQGTVGTDAPG